MWQTGNHIKDDPLHWWAISKLTTTRGTAGCPLSYRETGPNPGMLNSTSACWCSDTFSLISASSLASSSFRVRISRARAATIPSPMCWAGTMVCWDFAASMAAAATAAEERAPCFFDHAWILASPARRIPSGVRCLVSSNSEALDRL